MEEELRFIFVRNDLLLNKNYLALPLLVGDKIHSILSVGFANDPYGVSVANNVPKERKGAILGSSLNLRPSSVNMASGAFFTLITLHKETL